MRERGGCKLAKYPPLPPPPPLDKCQSCHRFLPLPPKEEHFLGKEHFQETTFEGGGETLFTRKKRKHCVCRNMRESRRAFCTCCRRPRGRQKASPTALFDLELCRRRRRLFECKSCMFRSAAAAAAAALTKFASDIAIHHRRRRSHGARSHSCTPTFFL